MKHIKKIFMLATLLVAVGAFGQSTLTQTTLSSAVFAGTGNYNGVNGPVSNTIFVASTTGFTAALNNQPVASLYVDNELMGILSFNSTTGAVSVLRGLGGKESPHNSGAMVLVGFNNQFQYTDPPNGGSCLSTAITTTPWINVTTGNQWLCSSVTNTWVPGWGNDIAPPVPTAAVASAAGLVTPSGQLFHITGTAAITGFNIPVGFNRGNFCVIPDGIFTTTTANNIALASTAVVSKPLCFSYDQNAAKFYPSY